MDLGLEGRVALVTGSHRGTGAGIARMVAAEGATVLVHGLEPGQTDTTVASITGAGGACHAVVGDIRTDAGTELLVTSVRDAVARVDIVVNNYGVAEGRDWTTSDAGTWHASYDTNVVTAVRVTRAFLPAMIERIVPIGSTLPLCCETITCFEVAGFLHFWWLPDCPTSANSCCF